MNPHKGLLTIVTGPSAVGKGAICRSLLQQIPHVRFSVSLTTRPARPGEIDGIEYTFVSREEFLRRVSAGELLEWAEVYGNLYGTPRSGVEAALDRGEDIILDIDIHGAAAVRAAYADSLSVFVIPPDIAELARRMRGRGTETEASVNRRLGEVPHWLEQGLAYDYVIVNDVLERAAGELVAILTAGKCRTSRRGGQQIRNLLERGNVEWR